jgi:N-carbamoyl-L-amino-acid hydrolase
VKESAEELEIKHQVIHSGAGHDAQFASYMMPTTMVFVQSKDGLSHCEPEYSTPEHCTAGASVVLNAVLKTDANK